MLASVLEEVKERREPRKLLYLGGLEDGLEAEETWELLWSWL